MRRRQFLALVGTGLAAGTAGCAGIGGNSDNQTNTTTETTTESSPDTGAMTTEATETTTTTARASLPATMNDETTNQTTGQRMATVTGTTGGGGDGSNGGGGGVSGQVTKIPDGLKVTKQWFYRKQFSTGVRGIIKNVSGSPFEYVEIRAAFYNAQGERIGVGIDHITDLAPGEKWPFEVSYDGSREPSRIVRYTLVVDTSPV